jgi:hypothetical protein
MSTFAISEDEEFKFDTGKWEKYSREVDLQIEKDRKNGISYIISGSLALLGGIIGERVAEDSSERGIYAVFQTIGVASIGYGAYTWQIGGEERSLQKSLQYSNLSAEQKSQFLSSYVVQRKSREKQDRKIRAITHGLISALNFYNASQQKQEGLKSALYFVGSVNLLAAISFTFEF